MGVFSDTNLKVGDVYDIRWSQCVNDFSWSRYMKERLDVAVTKLKNLVSLSEESIRLFISPQLDDTIFQIIVIKQPSGWLVEGWDTERVLLQRIAVINKHSCTKADQLRAQGRNAIKTAQPLFTIKIEAYGGTTNQSG